MANIKNFIHANILHLIGTGIAIVIGFLLMMILKIIITRVMKRAKQKRGVTVARLVQSIFRYMIIIITIIAIIGIWGYDISTILAGAGIAGLIIGLGAQSLISDLLSGIGIVFENYYEIDDIVEIKGFKGKVVEISLRSTHILNWKGELKIFANGEIKEITNFSRNFSVANVFVTVDYSVNLEKVISMLQEKLPALKELYSQIFEGPTVLGVTDLGENGAVINVIAKTISEQHYAVERALRKTIKEILDDNDIKISLPQVVIHDER